MFRSKKALCLSRKFVKHFAAGSFHLPHVFRLAVGSTLVDVRELLWEVRFSSPEQVRSSRSPARLHTGVAPQVLTFSQHHDTVILYVFRTDWSSISSRGESHGCFQSCDHGYESAEFSRRTGVSE